MSPVGTSTILIDWFTQKRARNASRSLVSFSFHISFFLFSSLFSVLFLLSLPLSPSPSHVRLVFVRDLCNAVNEDRCISYSGRANSCVASRPWEKAELDCIFDLHADQRDYLGNENRVTSTARQSKLCDKRLRPNIAIERTIINGASI